MANRLRPELPRLSRRIQRLSVDKRGYPVPWFVARFDGEPDFRVFDPAKFVRAIKERRCWVCGDKLSAFNYFVISPYCAVTRSSTEPPCHEDCAEFSVRACPFLTRPDMHRRTALLPEMSFDGTGAVVAQSPGVILIWATLTYEVVPAEKGAVCKLGEPMTCRWYKEGRKATRREVLASVSEAFPALGMRERDIEGLMSLYDRTAEA